MYSQKNVVQVFVSKYVGTAAAAVALKALKEGSIALFDANTELAVDAVAKGVPGFVAFNDKGVIKRGKTFLSGAAVADIIAPVAVTPRKEVVTVPTAVEGEYYQITLTIIRDNGMGEEMLQGVHVAKAADTSSSIATALALSLNRSLDRRGVHEVTIVAAAATVEITSASKKYVPGRKQGGIQSFRSALNYPEVSADLGDVTETGVTGLGLGWQVHSLELFAQGNSDSVSRNEFRTAQALELNTLIGKTYGMWAVDVSEDVDTASAKVPVSATLICAFQADGGAVPA